MGFRDYDPGLNRYMSRDLYNGALDDMALGMDPWNTNRYAFAGGNPISGVELDGHRPDRVAEIPEGERAGVVDGSGEAGEVEQRPGPVGDVGERGERHVFVERGGDGVM